MSTRRRGRVVEVPPETLRERLEGDDSEDGGEQADGQREAGSEQRHAARLPADLQLDIPLPSWEQARRVYTTNISAGGLMFRVQRPVTLPGQADVTLSLPDGQTVTLRSEIRHAAAVPGTGEIEVGVQFKRVPDEVHEVLRAALAKLAPQE